MRNLKRVLALAMAMVMILGMMVIGTSAASYSDEAAIDPDYAVAVEVLTGMGVFRGTGTGFAPKATLSRAEAAALIYRVISADVTDSKIDLYDYSSFDDVKAGEWYTGYVTYAANGGHIVGDGTGKFNPTAQVTGVQVLKIMLSAMGYGQKGEFEGAGWSDNVLTKADDLGLLDNVNVNSLNVPATREIVAQLLFDAIQAKTTTYTPAFGYWPSNTTLGEEKFGLDSTDSADKWGRPAIVWYDARIGTTKGTYATIKEAPLATYYNAVTECQIASDIGLDEVETFVLYTNGKVNASSYDVQPLDTVQKIGAQGTLVEVYEDEIVVIDTFLAEVIDVKDAIYDAAGHLKVEATIKLAVYTDTTHENAAEYNVALTNGETNYTYAKGDMLLVNAYTKNNVDTKTGYVTVKEIATTQDKTTKLNIADYAVIVDYAPALVGAQTFQWYNATQHTIDGATYDNSAWYKLDEAQYSDANFTWYFDLQGNVIGSADIATTYAYGIIENIQWINPELASGYAKATIRYMDGTTDVQVIKSIDGNDLKYATDISEALTPGVDNYIVSTSLTENGAYCGKHLYRIYTNSKGTLELVHVFTDADKDGWDADDAINEIKNADINPYGTGVNALAIISGTEGSVYVNSNTVFLIQTINNATKTVSYEVVTGYENVPTYYKNNAVIDWVKLDNDSYVDYVYITGTPDSAESMGMFYLTSPTVKYFVKNGIKTYYLEGILDGTPATVEVSGKATISNTAITNLTDTYFAANVNRMYTVQIEDGVIVKMWGPKSDINGDRDLFAETGNNVIYTGTKLDYQPASVAGTTGVSTYDGQVLKVADAYYSVVNLTPVFGAWAKDLSAKNIYVIFDYNKTVNVTVNGTAVSAYVAKAVYIATPAEGITDSGDNTTETEWNANWKTGFEVDVVNHVVYTDPADRMTMADLADTGSNAKVYYQAPGAAEVLLEDGDEKCRMTIASLIDDLGYTVTLVNDNYTAGWAIVTSK